MGLFLSGLELGGWLALVHLFEEPVQPLSHLVLSWVEPIKSGSTDVNPAARGISDILSGAGDREVLWEAFRFDTGQATPVRCGLSPAIAFRRPVLSMQPVKQLLKLLRALFLGWELGAIGGVAKFR